MKLNAPTLVLSVLALQSFAWGDGLFSSKRPIARIDNVSYGRVSGLAGDDVPAVAEDSAGGSTHCEDRGSGDVLPDSGSADSFPGSDIAGDLASSGFGAPSGGYSASPAMIGDFFGGGATAMLGSRLKIGTYDPATIAIAGGDRRSKVAENTSPIPTDRIFFNYHHFANPLMTMDGRTIDLDRFTFGLEKTFLDGNASFEIRIPFAAGLSANQIVSPGSPSDNESTEFGNISLVSKALLVARDSWALSAGVTFNLPTADDITVSSVPGVTEFAVSNESLHIQPFVGFLWQPNECLWVLAFGQLDFDVNGNPVDTYSSNLPTSAGVLQEQNLLYMDVSAGYWLYRNPCSRCLTGLAIMAECHYTTTMNDTDRVDLIGGDSIFNPHNRVDVLNATGALRLHFGTQTIVSLAGVAPLREEGDKLFDSEFGLQVTRLY